MGDKMSRKEQQKKIAEILKDLGLEDDLIKTMTSLSNEELKNTNK